MFSGRWVVLVNAFCSHFFVLCRDVREGGAEKLAEYGNGKRDRD